jgi:hypothetical protein
MDKNSYLICFKECLVSDVKDRDFYFENQIEIFIFFRKWEHYIISTGKWTYTDSELKLNQYLFIFSNLKASEKLTLIIFCVRL